MCGIAGVLSLDGRPVPERMVGNMIGALAHRGPDGEGFFVDSAVSLGHRRLSIIDLDERAAQPMRYGDRFVITFNGDIYNYLELRGELEQKAHRFHTNSDTEVLVAAFAEWGRDCLLRLDGMYAFAIWDRVDKRLFCARDPFGEKPFFYCEVPGLLVFASEMKAFGAGGIPLSLRTKFLHGLLRHKVVHLPDFPDETFYAPAKTLRPAHCLEVRPGQSIRIERYWQIGTDRSTTGIPDAADHLRALLARSVKRRLRSDVPVGSSLSGGIDSSSIVSLIRELGSSNQHTFSARFDDLNLDEGRYMQAVRAAIGAERHEVWPTGEGLGEEFSQLFYHQEEPFPTPSPYAQWTVMRLAKQSGVTVLLDGQGADEMLAGYTHYFQPLLIGLARRNLLHAFREFRAIGRLYPNDSPTISWLRHALIGRLPEPLARLNLALRDRRPRWLDRDFDRAHAKEPRPFRSFNSLSESLSFSTLEHGLETLLRYADRSSMAFGREVRLPFLDRELVSWVFTLPEQAKIHEGVSKRLLRDAMRGLVPDVILDRHDKKGFEVPVNRWLATPQMHQRALDSQARLRREGAINCSVLSNSTAMWNVVSAAAVYDFLDRANALGRARH
ncbi:MAG: asparagine synthase (glutamine-hydrolyzing) [Fimbriimonadaceae bacterium]|nr:asparagine synthase (glutamine-hydrolyzing) [Fimbriimonadaceae bacterium]